MSQRHLLIPLDGSELAEAVLPIAGTLATSVSADLTLVMVVPPGSGPGSTRAPADYLQQIAVFQPDRSLEVHTTIRLGDAAEEILELAREIGSDLIVMATHGRSGLGRSAFGSVADQVVQRSTVPVLLLHPNRHPVDKLRTLVVPVDGTPGGALALATAVPVAQASQAKLVLVRATVPLPLWLYDPTLGLDTGPLINPMWDEDARQAAETYAEGLAARLRGAGLSAEGRGTSGQPGAVIVAAADEVDADLIVMSTHARGGALRSILGSVANEVVRQTRRPVLLLHRPSRGHESEARSLGEAAGPVGGLS